MFDNLTHFNPFSANSRMSIIYPAFSAILIPEFTVESDKIITFTFPQRPKTEGFIDIIAENEAGYGKLTTDSRYPFVSSFVGAEDIQNPWVDGMIILNNPNDPLDRRIYIQILSENLKYYIFDGNIQTLANQYQLQTINHYGDVVENPEWLSTNTDIGTIDSTGLVEYVSGGYTTVSALRFDHSDTKYLQMSALSSIFLTDIISSANIFAYSNIYNTGLTTTTLTENFSSIQSEDGSEILSDLQSYLLGRIDNYVTYTDLVGVSSNRVNFTYSGTITSINQFQYRASGDGYGYIVADFGTNQTTYTFPVSNKSYTIPYVYLNLIDLPNTTTVVLSAYKDRTIYLNSESKTWQLSAYDITDVSQPIFLDYIEDGPIQRVDNTITSLSSGPFTVYLSALSSQYITGTAITSSTVLSSGFVEGSLAWTFNNEVERRLAGKTPSPIVPLHTINQQMSYWTTNTYTVRNSACWMADVDMSFYSVAKDNTSDGSGSRAILIAPDICLFAAHYQKYSAFPVTITWRNSAGYAYTGYVASSANTVDMGMDLLVAKLSNDVNSSIKPVRMLSSDWGMYLPNITKNAAMVAGSQDQKYSPVYLNSLYRISNSPSPDPNAFFYYVSAYYVTIGTARTDNWQANGSTGHDGYWIGGDSSSPLGFLYNNEFILAGLAQGPGFSVPFIPEHVSSLNNAMSALGSVYRCQYPSLTAFPTY